MHASPPPSRRLAPARAQAPVADKRDAILRAATAGLRRATASSSRRSPTSRAPPASPPGTVYLYFRSKDDLLVSLFERTMREAIAEGRAALEGVDDPRERLTRIARLHLERLGRDRDLAVVFQVELRQSTKFMERFSSTYLRDYLGLIRETIAAGQQARVVPPRHQPDDRRQGVLRRARRDGHQLDPEQAALFARRRSRCGRRSLRRRRRPAGDHVQHESVALALS